MIRVLPRGATEWVPLTEWIHGTNEPPKKIVQPLVKKVVDDKVRCPNKILAHGLHLKTSAKYFECLRRSQAKTGKESLIRIPCPNHGSGHLGHYSGSGKLETCRKRALVKKVKEAVIHCQHCRRKHIDTGRFATFNHKSHLCGHCRKFFETAEANVGVEKI